MNRRLFELVEPFEIVLDETLYPPEAIALLPPIVDGKNGEHAQRLDVLAGLDEIGIVLVRQRTRGIIIGKLFAELDGEELKAGFWLVLAKWAVRFPAGMDDGVYIARLHLLDRDRVADEHDFGMDAQALKHDGSRRRRAAAADAQADFFAIEIL